MRLDKYLKLTRIIKRRTVANDACDTQRVSVNGRQAKASYDVKIGDIIEHKCLLVTSKGQKPSIPHFVVFGNGKKRKRRQKAAGANLSNCTPATFFTLLQFLF